MLILLALAFMFLLSVVGLIVTSVIHIDEPRRYQTMPTDTDTRRAD